MMPTQNAGMPSPTIGTARTTWSTGAVLAARGERRQRDGDQHREHRAVGEQPERHRRALDDQLAHGHAVEQRVAEVAVREPLEEQPVLLGQRAVEAPLVVQLRDQLRRRAGAEHRDRRVAREEAHEQERHHRHADRDRHELRQPPQHVGETIHDVPALG